MKIEKVWGVYWSATGNTQKAVESLTEVLGECLGCPRELVRFTLPEDRGEVLEFYPGELVVVGSPVYAGKLPNKILPDFQTKLKGGGALAVGIVTFGNRALTTHWRNCAQCWRPEAFIRRPGQPLWDAMRLPTGWLPGGRIRRIWNS